jgi:hypothetical protein
MIWLGLARSFILPKIEARQKHRRFNSNSALVLAQLKRLQYFFYCVDETGRRQDVSAETLHPYFDCYSEYNEEDSGGKEVV